MQANAMSLLMTVMMLLCLEVSTGAKASPPCTQILSQSERGVTTYTLYSHDRYYLVSSHPSNVSCFWSVPPPDSVSAWEVRFHEIDLEASITTRQCKYDNLTVTFQLDGPWMNRTLCGKHFRLLLLTTSGFQLKFQSDVSVNNKGFRIMWRKIRRADLARRTAEISPVFRQDDRAGSCGSLKSPNVETNFDGQSYNLSQVSMSQARGTYLHGADCTWNIVPPAGSAVYVTFTVISLEGSEPCQLDNITVIYLLPGRNQSQQRVLCSNPVPIRLVSTGPVIIQLQTDSSVGNELNFQWFVAPYTKDSVRFETSNTFRRAENCPAIDQTPTGGRISLYYDYPMEYEPRTRCNWILDVPLGMVAQFSFSQFQLARGYYRQWQRYNYTRYYCTYRDDTVRIATNQGMGQSFCSRTNVQTGKVLLSLAGRVFIHFVSSELGGGRGFILHYNLRAENLTGLPNCPPIKALDNYRQMIANLSNDQPNKIYNKHVCNWTLGPKEGHYMYLTVTVNPIWDYQASVGAGPSFDRSCKPRVTITSQSKVESDDLLLGNGTTPQFFREVFCPRVRGMQVGPFDGAVNVTVEQFRQGFISLDGFAVQSSSIPKPKADCKNLVTNQKHSQWGLVKVFNFTGKPGCIVAATLTDSQNIYSNSQLNITFQLTCSSIESNEELEVYSGSSVNSVRCGETKSIRNSWNNYMVLKFPTRTHSRLVCNVFFDYPVQQAFCQSLNGRSAIRGQTAGSLLLPLVASTLDFRLMPLRQQSFGLLSCNYELPFRNGFSILLKISHNLANDDLDYFCHLKLLDERLSPHILLTVNERVRDLLDTWRERQLDICVGESVGSLSTQSELLVDGSLKISHLLVSEVLMNTVNLSSVVGLRDWRFANRDQPQKPRFVINYEYVPFCPEITCRSSAGPQSECPLSMSNALLEAPLLANARTCKLTVPTSDRMRRALVSQSSTWMLKLEVSNFSLECPCHSCKVEEEEDEYLTISAKTLEIAESEPEELVVCGDYRNKVREIKIVLNQNDPEVQISYNLDKSGANIQMSFVDCQANSGQGLCSMAIAEKKLFNQPQSAQLEASHTGGLIVGVVLLAAVLVGCLAFINREFLMARGNRIQESLQQRVRVPSYGEDTLQLNAEGQDAN